MAIQQDLHVTNLDLGILWITCIIMITFISLLSLLMRTGSEKRTL